jgi:hypothetical protein
MMAPPNDSNIMSPPQKGNMAMITHTLLLGAPKSTSIVGSNAELLQVQLPQLFAVQSGTQEPPKELGNSRDNYG